MRYLLLLFFSIEALSFPANTRLGYGNCTGCHHSPTGGGVLTEYGSSTAGEISTIGFEVEDYTKKYPVFAGGDFRYLYVHTESREVSFPMQADAELGISLFGLKAIGQLGLYGENKKVASYQAYIMYTHGAHSLRLGHFAPAFGINEPDHYLPGRNSLGFDDRSASMNLEYNYAGRRFSLNLAAIGGRQGALYDSEATGIYQRPGKAGGSIQVAVFPFKGLWVAASGALLYDIEKQLSDHPRWAFSVIYGNAKNYLKAEHASQLNLDTLGIESESWSQFTTVPLPGLHTGIVSKVKKESFAYGCLLVWYPIAGLEVQTLLEREISSYTDATKFLGMLHLYF